MFHSTKDMKDNYPFKPASQDEITLYCYMGETVCMIQELESALSVSITIKKHSTATQEEGDKALNKQRRYTLGTAIQLAQKEKLFPWSLQSALNDFYKRRNWFIHDAMFESKDNRTSEIVRNQLFQKIKSIANDAPNFSAQ
jgi:hypothetical protein